MRAKNERPLTLHFAFVFAHAAKFRFPPDLQIAPSDVGAKRMSAPGLSAADCTCSSLTNLTVQFGFLAAI